MHIASSGLANIPHDAVVEDMNTFTDFDTRTCTSNTDDTMARLEQRLVAPDLTTRELGAEGERYAAVWLERLGWRTLAKNWRTRFGELDLIMLTPEQTMVFVEVKTRHTQRYGPGQEAVTADKRAHLRHAAALWLSGPGRCILRIGIRFDVVAILVKGQGLFVNHIREAF
jgi:putative endonuclease